MRPPPRPAADGAVTTTSSAPGAPEWRRTASISASGSRPNGSITSERPRAAATGARRASAAANRSASRSTPITSRGPDGMPSALSMCIWPIGPAAPTTTVTPLGAQLRAVAGLAVRGSHVRTAGADVGGVVIVQAADVDLDVTVERLVGDQVHHAPEGQRVGGPRHHLSRGGGEHDDVVEGAALGPVRDHGYRGRWRQRANRLLELGCRLRQEDLSRLAREHRRSDTPAGRWAERRCSIRPPVSGVSRRRWV